MTMISRRMFCLSLVWPAMAVRAEGRRPTVGVLLAAPMDRQLQSNPMGDSNARAFSDALRELGWVDKSSVRVVWRSFELREEGLPGLVRELAGMPVDVLVVSGNPGALASRAHSSLKTVIAAAYHPDEYGIVETLSKPGGRITGALLEPGRGINAKRIALMKEAVPGLKRFAYLSWRNFRPDVHDEVQGAASLQDVTAIAAEVEPDGFPRAFAAALGQGAEAILVGSGGIYYRPEIQAELHGLAIRHRLPVMHCLLAPGESGGLMAYATDLRENYRVAARMVDRILRGVHPRDIPMEQASKFVFTVNLAAARAIGLAMPKSILLQADRVFE